MVNASDIAIIIVALLLPPAAVLIERGCSVDFLINIVFTLLGYIPGHIHAFYIIYKRHQRDREYGYGGYGYGPAGTSAPAQYGATNPPPVGGKR